MLDLSLRLLFNFVVVFVGIVLFMAPFYLYYRRKHYKSTKHHEEFNRSLESFFNSRQANWLAFAWAVGEATVWFVIPEFLLLLVLFMRLHRRLQLVIYDAYGTVVGTLIGLTLHPSPAFLDHIPFIQPRMLEQVTAWYDEHGLGGLVFQAFSGVPYKLFVGLAPDYHFFVPVFIIFALMVRISRYYLLYAIFQSLYPVLNRYVYRHYIPLFIGAVFFFSLALLKVSLAYR